MNSRDAKSLAQRQFGVSIKYAPAPFNRTVVLTIVPRYVIINKLQRQVAIRQVEHLAKAKDETKPKILPAASTGDKEHTEVHF